MILSVASIDFSLFNLKLGWKAGVILLCITVKPVGYSDNDNEVILIISIETNVEILSVYLQKSLNVNIVIINIEMMSILMWKENIESVMKKRIPISMKILMHQRRRKKWRKWRKWKKERRKWRKMIEEKRKRKKKSVKAKEKKSNGEEERGEVMAKIMAKKRKKYQCQYLYRNSYGNINVLIVIIQ